MEEKNKTNKILIVVIIILAMIVGGLTTYIILDKKDNNKVEEKDNKTEENNKSDNTDKNDSDNKEDSKNPVEVTNFDKAMVNEKLPNLNIALEYALNIQIGDRRGYYMTHYDDMPLNTELLSSSDRKFCYAWANANFDNITTSSSGLCVVDFVKFSNYYKDLYNEELSNNNEYNCGDGNKFEVKDGKLYGSFGGWLGMEAISKINKITKSNIDESITEYTLLVDLIYDMDENLDNPWENLEKYQKPSVLNYPDSMVIAKFELKYQKNNDNYILKSLKKVK